MNLKTETIEVLKNNNKDILDIKWCGSEKLGWFTWKDFIEVAPENYDDEYGISINEDLFVVGEDWWLERHEYDCGEWWEYKTMPVKPTEYKISKTLFNK